MGSASDPLSACHKHGTLCFDFDGSQTDEHAYGRIHEDRDPVRVQPMSRYSGVVCERWTRACFPPGQTSQASTCHDRTGAIGGTTDDQGRHSMHDRMYEATRISEKRYGLWDSVNRAVLHRALISSA